jgi:hypothetical protein
MQIIEVLIKFRGECRHLDLKLVQYGKAGVIVPVFSLMPKDSVIALPQQNGSVVIKH